MNLLLLITIAIPLFNSALTAYLINSQQGKNKLIEFSNKACAIIFIIILLGLFRNLKNNYIEFLDFNSHIYLGLQATKYNISQLFLLAFLWLIFIFFGQKFLEIEKKTSNKFNLFLSLFVSFLNLLILSICICLSYITI